MVYKSTQGGGGGVQVGPRYITTIAANLAAKFSDISGVFVGPLIDTYYSLKGVKKNFLLLLLMRKKHLNT